MTKALAGQRSMVALTVAAMMGLGVLLGLGGWQLQRMDEKQNFLSQLAREAKATPRSDWATTPDFARVSLTGRFLPAKTAFVRVTMPEVQGPGIGGSNIGGTVSGGVNSGGLGLYVVTPLQLENGSVVLVNRGFVRTGVENRPPSITAPEDEITITGFRRPPEQRNLFSVPDDLARLVFAVRDPAGIATALDLNADKAAFLEAERNISAPAGSPRGVDADELFERIPNNHLQYAMTWFGLAATLIGVYLAFILARRREAKGG